MITRLKALSARGVLEKAIDWETIYTETLPPIYNFFRYRVGDGPLAEDLTATTFEKVWRARKHYRRERGALSTWVFTIARNVAVDHFRQASRGVQLHEAWEAAASPEETFEAIEEFARLTELLGQLSPRERELIALKYGADLNNRQIASLTSLSETNVGTVLHRALEHLRKEWEVEP